jgi:Rox3 mediator complex subunit
MTMYKLNDIATTVRRVDPATGEKINKIRKSYEGKVKALSVAGRNKAISTPGQWVPQGLFKVPEDDYRATRVLGKEIENGLTDAFMAKLDRAIQMAPGKLPEREAEKWKALIGTEEPAPQVKAKATVDAKDTVDANAPQKPSPLPSSAAAASMRSASSPAGAKLARPERTGTKRRYNDASFTGYGEGFLNEEDASDEDARSTTSGGIKKKRRKVSMSSAHLLSPRKHH